MKVLNIWQGFFPPLLWAHLPPLAWTASRILKRYAVLMFNRHAASNIQNAIKTQGQPWILIRKCNHKNHHSLIATNSFCEIPRMHLSSLWNSSTQSMEATKRKKKKKETLYQLIAYWHPLNQPPPHNLLSGPFQKPHPLNSHVTWQQW